MSRKELEVTPLSDAVMFVTPAASAVARPVLLMVTAVVLEEIQATWEVMLAIEPSL